MILATQLKHCACHPYWRLKKAFSGSQEHDTAPILLTREEVLERVDDVYTVFGKDPKEGKKVKLPYV